MHKPDKPYWNSTFNDKNDRDDNTLVGEGKIIGWFPEQEKI